MSKKLIDKIFRRELVFEECDNCEKTIAIRKSLYKKIEKNAGVLPHPLLGQREGFYVDYYGEIYCSMDCAMDKKDGDY